MSVDERLEDLLPRPESVRCEADVFTPAASLVPYICRQHNIIFTCVWYVEVKALWFWCTYLNYENLCSSFFSHFTYYRISCYNIFSHTDILYIYVMLIKIIHEICSYEYNSWLVRWRAVDLSQEDPCWQPVRATKTPSMVLPAPITVSSYLYENGQAINKYFIYSTFAFSHP